MQGIEATFDDLPFERGRDSRKLLIHIALGAVALAAAGRIGMLVWHALPAAPPNVVVAPPGERPAPALKTEVAASAFGAMIVEPEWNLRPAAAQTADLMPLPSLEPFPAEPAAPPLQASLEAAPPTSAPSAKLPDNAPLPPVRDVARTDDNFPLPPTRPPEFASAPPEIAPDRRASLNPAPADNRNVFQRLFGLGAPSTPSAPAPSPERTQTPAPAIASAPAATSAAHGRSGLGLAGLFAAFSHSTGFDRFGYDRYPAVYDISARTVYLPD